MAVSVERQGGSVLLVTTLPDPQCGDSGLYECRQASGLSDSGVLTIEGKGERGGGRGKGGRGSAWRGREGGSCW